MLTISKALEHWTRLNKANTQLAELLSALCKKGRVDQESYAKALKSMVGIAAAEVIAYPLQRSSC